MKRIFRFMMAALAATAAMTACQQEKFEPEVQEQETVQVTVTIGDQTKGFSDLEGITWEVGDQIKYAGGVELTSEPLTAEQISEDGYTASFTFAASLNEVDRTGWFCSTKCHPSNYKEVEFTLGVDNGNIITQDVAGEMNSRYIFLHSGTGLISITKDQAPVVTMDVAGTIFRAIPYTTLYNDEKVVSVKLQSNTKLVGTVAYDRGGGTYKGVNDVDYKSYDFVQVTLGTNLSLEGVTSAVESNGIYLPVAATPAAAPLNGYKYVVVTDKATYTFDAMEKTLVVGENVVKNFMLNLDKATREEINNNYIFEWGEITHTKIPASSVPVPYFNIVADSDVRWKPVVLMYENNSDVGVNFTNITKVSHVLEEGEWRYGNGYIALHIAENTTYSEKLFIISIVTDEVAVDNQTLTTELIQEAKQIPVEGFTFKWADYPTEIAVAGGPTYFNITSDPLIEWTAVVTIDDVVYENNTIIKHANGGGYVCVHVPANTTSATKEVKVAVTTTSEYVYTEKTITAIATQLAEGVDLGEGEGGDEEGGEVVVEGYTFDIVKSNGNGSGATWGMPVNGKNGADFRIENIKLDGEAVTLTEETANEVLSLAFKNIDERPAAGYDGYNFATAQIYMNLISYNGSTLEAGVATTEDSQGYITRLTWYNSDGTEAGHWFVFVP